MGPLVDVFCLALLTVTSREPCVPAEENTPRRSFQTHKN